MVCTVLAVLALGAVACSGDEGDGSGSGPSTADGSAPVTTAATGTTRPPWDADNPPSTQDYVAGLVTGLTSGSADQGDLVLSAEQARCVAPTWIDTMGTDALHRAEVRVTDLEDPGFNYTAMSLEQAQGEVMVAAFGTCGVDIRSLIVDLVAPDAAAENRACAEEAFDNGLIERFLTAALVDEEPSTQLRDELFEISTRCGLV